MQYKRYSNRYTYSRPIRRQQLMIAPPKYVNYVRSLPTKKGGDPRAIIFLIGLAILGIFAWKSVAHPAVASNTTVNASHALMRVDQSSVSQYDSQQQYEAWWPSVCSTASLTEVFNAYGNHYRIADVLAKESSIGAITAQSGLEYPTGIDDTAKQFGFETQTLENPSVSQVTSIADAGKPVIVSFPPGTWSSGGHILVVTGGWYENGQLIGVKLADSSIYDMKTMTTAKFLSYWRGFAKVVTPKNIVTQVSVSVIGGQHDVRGTSTISVNTINSILSNAGSPAAGKGQVLYDLGVQYGINPAYALAFFHHESSYGTSGEAVATLALGNERCISDRPCIDQNRGGYAQFYSWQDGFEHWYMLIRNLYINTWGCATIETIIPHYAPTADNNDEYAYENAVIGDVQSWK